MEPLEPMHALLVAIREELAENTRKTDQVLKAFPGGDCEGHRRYHEGVIEWQDLRNKLVREALIKVAGASGVGAFGWVAYALWKSFILTVKQ